MIWSPPFIEWRLFLKKMVQILGTNKIRCPAIAFTLIGRIPKIMHTPEYLFENHWWE